MQRDASASDLEIDFQRPNDVTPSSLDSSARSPGSSKGDWTPRAMPSPPPRATPSPHDDDGVSETQSSSGRRSPSRLDEFFTLGTPRNSQPKTHWLRRSAPFSIRRSSRSVDSDTLSSPKTKDSPRNRDALSVAPGRAKTKRPLPERIVKDGFCMPEFEFANLESVSERPVASGNQAHIYSAVVPAGSRKGRVAIKVIRRDLAAQDAEHHAFIREVRLLGRVAHPHVINALGVGTTPSGLPCVMLSWCQGTVTRALRLDEVDYDPEIRDGVRRRWPSRDRLRLLAELADALDHLHTAAIPGAHIAHRDMKPNNLGLGANRQLILLDFGLSVALFDSDSKSGETFDLTGDTGTRRYMAPEVARKERYGVGVDVYGWAICAYEIFTLKGKPYYELSLDRHLAEVCVPNGLRPALPARWDPRLRDELFPAAWAEAGDRCDAAHCRDSIRAILADVELADPLGGAHDGCCVVA